MLAVSGVVLILAMPNDAAPRTHPRSGSVIVAGAPSVAPPTPPNARTAAIAAPRAFSRARVAPVQPTPTSPRGPRSGAEDELENAPDLFARLAIIDRLMQSELPGTVVSLIEKLLERTPGRTDEVRPFRVALLGRLGAFPQNAEADRRLVVALEPERPRCERLIAIEALARGGLHPLGRPYLQRIADSDHDLEVKRRAQSALGVASPN
jgi:hypothetical protein